MTTEDRRGDGRMPVTWNCELIFDDDKSRPCRIVDVSLAGTKVECDATVEKGDEVILVVPSVGEFAGSVQWVGKGSFGLALQAGPDLLLKRIAEDPESYPTLAAQSRASND